MAGIVVVAITLFFLWRAGKTEWVLPATVLFFWLAALATLGDLLGMRATSLANRGKAIAFLIGAVLFSLVAAIKLIT